MCVLEYVLCYEFCCVFFLFIIPSTSRLAHFVALLYSDCFGYVCRALSGYVVHAPRYHIRSKRRRRRWQRTERERVKTKTTKNASKRNLESSFHRHCCCFLSILSLALCVLLWSLSICVCVFSFFVSIQCEILPTDVLLLTTVVAFRGASVCSAMCVEKRKTEVMLSDFFLPSSS